jgi:DNA-directed RNA polymerase subunit RPC12/RpoP
MRTITHLFLQGDSGTVYQVHDEDGVANCWPTYHHNADKIVFECTRCREQFNIGLYDTTEETEDYYPTRCPTCNCKDLVVKDVKHGDAHRSTIVDWFND